MKIYSLTFCLFFSCVCHTLLAQTAFDRKYGAKVLAYQAIKTMKDSGTLLVMLPMRRNEINSLQRKIASPDLSDKERAHMITALAMVRSDKEKMVNQMLLAFKTTYTFSDIAFAWDTSATAYKRGQRDNIVLNDDLSGTIPRFEGGKFTALLQYSVADNAWFLVNDQLNPVGKPFPYRVDVSKGGFKEGDKAEVALAIQFVLLDFYNDALQRMPKLDYLRQKAALKAQIKAMKNAG